MDQEILDELVAHFLGEMNFAYISGPMRGKNNNNKDAFDWAEAILLDAGYLVLNPASMTDPDWTWADYMKRDIAILTETIDCVFALPGWEYSQGAVLEILVASATGLPVYCFQTFEKTGTLQQVNVPALPVQKVAEPGKVDHPTPKAKGLDALETWLKDLSKASEAQMNKSGGFSIKEGEPWTVVKGIPTSLAKPTPDELDDHILVHADKLINGPRQDAYSHPLDDLGRIAAIWTQRLNMRKDPKAPISAEDACWMMADLKWSRAQSSPDQADHYADAAGYVGCAWKCRRERKRRAG